MRDAAFLLLKAAQRPQQLLVGAACNTPTAAAASPPAARFKIKDVLTPKMRTACLYLGPRAEHCLHPHQSRNQGATEGIPAPGERPGGKAGTPQPASLQRPDRRGWRPRAAPGHARPDSLAPHLPDCAPEPRRHPALRAGTPLTPTLGWARSHPRAGTLTDPHPGPGTLSPTFTPRPDPTPTSHPGPARPGPLAPLRRPPSTTSTHRTRPSPARPRHRPPPQSPRTRILAGRAGDLRETGRGPQRRPLRHLPGPRRPPSALSPAGCARAARPQPLIPARTPRVSCSRLSRAAAARSVRALRRRRCRRRRPNAPRPRVLPSPAQPPASGPAPAPHGPRRQGTPPRAPCTCAGARHAGSRSPAGGVRCMPGVGSVVALAPPTARVWGYSRCPGESGDASGEEGRPRPGSPGARGATGGEGRLLARCCRSAPSSPAVRTTADDVCQIAPEILPSPFGAVQLTFPTCRCGFGVILPTQTMLDFLEKISLFLDSGKLSATVS